MRNILIACGLFLVGALAYFLMIVLVIGFYAAALGAFAAAVWFFFKIITGIVS